MRSWLESESDELRSVIVEADVEPPKVRFERSSRGFQAPVDIVGSDSESVAAAMDKLELLLRELPLQEPPTRLDSSHVFVVTVSGHDLRPIVESGAVRQVRANASVRAPR